MLGSLADKIRVPDQHIVAIETALGHHLQLVLTGPPETAQQILADLATNRKGKASIAALALQSPPSNGPDVPEPLKAERQTVAALSVIEADPSVQSLLQGLLGQTLIVADLGVATAAWRQWPGAFDLVTPRGELLTRHGIFTGGSVNGDANKAPASILGRKNQIAELQAQLAQMQQQVSDASRQKGALQSEQTSLQAGLQQAQTELRNQEVAIAAHQGELHVLENSRRSLASKIKTVVYEVQALAAHEQEGRRKRASITEQASQLEAREQAAQGQVTELTAALEQLGRDRDAANIALTEAKVTQAGEEQLHASLGRQQGPLEQRLGELAQLAQQRRTECRSFLERKGQFESEMGDSRRQIERLQHEREVVNAQTADLLRQREGQERDIAEQEENLRELRRHLAEFQQRRGAFEVELAQKTMSVQNLRERIQQKYQVSLDDIRSECITIILADEGPARVQTLTPEEMAAAGVATDWDAVAGQVTALQKRLEEMGPVNLVAIEEYEETEQRYNFLSRQNEDLVQARTQLLEVINRINTQTREMFGQTFNRIRDNFRSMFSEIFGGGKK